MENRILVDIRDVSKTFETADGPVHALNRTNIFVEEGGFLSIVGPSGCGKTTLLKIIGGLIPTSSGAVTIADSVVAGPRDEISFVFQGSVLLPWKTAMENILLPVQVRRRVSAEDRRRAQELLELVGLQNFENRYPNELSGGMQQRVSICRALIQDPDCLLLDEPFGALDALTRENMNVFFNKLWRETRKTMIMVTHSIQEAVFLSTRVVVMSRRPGEIIDEVAVPFGRERNPEIIGSQQFGDIATQIRRYFTDNAVE